VEIKKSKKARLDDKRPTWFLLGLVFVLSLLFVALEYTSDVGDDSIDDDMLEGLYSDMDPMPLVDTRRYTAVSSDPSGNTTVDRLKVVESISSAVQDNPGAGDEPEADGEGADTGDDPVSDEEPLVPEEKPEDDDKPMDFRVVEQLPEFPGGMQEFVRWLTANLRYPQPARERKIEGKVVVSFIINRDGSIADIKVAKAVNPLLDREALRVMRMMPEWKPGIDKAKPCRTMIAIPIVFKL